MLFKGQLNGSRLRSKHHVEKYFHLLLYNKRVDGARAFKIVSLTPWEQSNKLDVLPRARPIVLASEGGRATGVHPGGSAGPP